MLTMKHLKRTMPNLLIRLLAVGAVFLWMGASEFCALETLIRHAHDEANAERVVQRATSAHDHSAPGQVPGRHDGPEHSCCTSLQTAELALPSVMSAKPDFGQVHPLLAVASAPLTLSAECLEALACPTPDREWVFTPEVSLGPALRSHAPPLLA